MLAGISFKLKCFIILSLTNIIVIYFIHKQFTNVHKKLQLINQKRYDIETSSCKIPHINPYEKIFLNLLDKQELNCEILEPLVKSNDTHLMINKNASRKYRPIKNIVCAYQSFRRQKPNRTSVDNVTVYDKNEVYFRNAIEVRNEFVSVKCFRNKNIIYQDFFAFVPLLEAHNSSQSLDKKLNVLIIGLDSVSRNHFHRQMPKTLDYLQNELGAIEYIAYHTVGNDTFSNLIPVFTGKTVDELKYCWPNASYRFDNCNFIWKKFHDKGYATSFAEEESWMGLFDYGKAGFNNQPTTHYWKPFNSELTNVLGEYNNTGTCPCLNDKPAVEYILDYTIKFINSYKRNGQNFFASFWECSITHDARLFYAAFDSTYRKHLQDINSTGVLNNTILFFMSDHGHRFKEIIKRRTFQEDLLLMFIVLPKWFKKLYSEATFNIQQNAKKLTSHFDLYETFEAIADKKFIGDTNNFTRGISLFQAIPEDRTCEKAGIPRKFCSCESPVSDDTNQINNHLT